MQIRQISKQEAQEMLKAGATIMVDVREPEEFELYRVDGQNIVNIPLKSITERLALWSVNDYIKGSYKLIKCSKL